MRKALKPARRFRLALVVALLAGGASSAISQSQKGPQAAARTAPTRQELDAARQWLSVNPSNGKNRDERRKQMAVIQTACDQLLPGDFFKYCACRTSDTQKADEWEKDGALYYLRQTTDHALQSIRATKVKKGLVVWHIYNMGYVFKTPDTCFGIDLFLRDGHRLAPDLDFLLITHEHGDHNCADLWLAMRKARKPTVMRWRPPGHPDVAATTQPAAFRFGSVRVKVDIGDHFRLLPLGRDNMLMFQVDCGPAANNCTIYHSGDGDNYRKMKPDRKVDIFIVAVAVGMSVPEAIAHIKPRITFVSHVLELGHSPKPPQAWRWSFDDAFKRIKGIPDSEAIVLTWGERWLLPGTVLEEK